MDAKQMAALDPAQQGPLGNEPESLAVMLGQNMREKHLALLTRRDQLLDAVTRVPEIVGDEETAGKVADFVKQITAAYKNAEATRVAEKEPFLESGRAVDGWFRAVTEPLERAKKLVEARLTVYQRAKADEERRRREAEERAAREAAQAAARAAFEAEQKIKTARDLDAAIAAQAAAEQAAADAAQAAKAADAKPADMSRTRGDFGGVASLRTEWTFDELDRRTLDLEALRQHIPSEALDKAVRSFIRAGGRELRGCRIFETTHTVVR